MAATSVAFNKLFEDNERATGEKVPKSMQLLIPANMRFGMYRTADTVKMENKFAALPLKMPLIKNMSYATKIQKVTGSYTVDHLFEKLIFFYEKITFVIWTTYS